jgi:polyphosphate kinase
LQDIIRIQLQDNIKARALDNALSNRYVQHEHQPPIRSQVEIYNYLHNKILTESETGSH